MLEENSVERVLCQDAFPHFRDLQTAFREIFRVLRPGGLFAINHFAGREFINSIHRASSHPEGRPHDPGRGGERPPAGSRFRGEAGRRRGISFLHPRHQAVKSILLFLKLPENGLEIPGLLFLLARRVLVAGVMGRAATGAQAGSDRSYHCLPLSSTLQA
ncbi:MAG TPA: hypothetical protein DD435_03890 [Cyanobacteria bacterium UBA8530]|nr:hypothetical protein [Cyanobacteria bacterium UBA8530]